MDTAGGQGSPRSDEPLATQREVVETELSGLAAEHGELTDTWKLVDTKAQITATAAGVFLGGIFAIQRGPVLPTLVLERSLLVLALALLVASVICALRSLQLRNVYFPPRGISMAGVFADLYQTDEFNRGGIGLRERLMAYKRDQIRIWKSVNESLLAALKSKARWTMAAQYLFGLGVLTFAGLSVIGIFGLRSSE